MHAALESPVPAEAESETYPRSAIEEAARDRSDLFSPFLPRRRPSRPARPVRPARPAVPPPAAPADDASHHTQPHHTQPHHTQPRHTQPSPAQPHPSQPDPAQARRTPAAVPAVRHQPPDLAVLSQVLRGLQRLA